MPDRPFASLGVEGRDLAVSRAGRVVFSGLSFTAPPAALTAIVGPNGSGKSTLLRLIAGLVRPDAGSLEISSEGAERVPSGKADAFLLERRERGALLLDPRLSLRSAEDDEFGGSPSSTVTLGQAKRDPRVQGGERLTRERPTSAVRALVFVAGNEGLAHYLGHLDALKPGLSLAETLSFFAAIYGARKSVSELQAAAEAVGLGHALDLPVGVLSAGQRRRAGLARLLVSPRPLWLLDEPTAALDRDGEAVLGRILAAHLADGGTVIAATHGELPLPPRFTLDLSPPA